MVSYFSPPSFKKGIMTEFNILIEEHELYEKHPLELVAMNVFDQMEEPLRALDYKFEVQEDFKIAGELSIDFYLCAINKENEESDDCAKWNNICCVIIPLFVFDTHQATPLINQITQYLHKVEQKFNKSIREHIQYGAPSITIHIEVLPKTKNNIDFYECCLRRSSDDEEEEKDEFVSSKKLSYKMSNYRYQLNEKLKSSAQYIHPEDIIRNDSQQLETITMRVSSDVLSKMKEGVDVNNLYCIKMTHPDNREDIDVPWHIEEAVEEHKDIEECAQYMKTCYVNDVKYVSFFVNGDDEYSIFSYFVGNKLQKASGPIVSKSVGMDAKAFFPCYILYNPSDEVQTFKIEDDGASVYIVEVMFADNGKDVFECYFRTDKECCGPDPDCEELKVERCRVKVVECEDDVDNEEEEDVKEGCAEEDKAKEEGCDEQDEKDCGEKYWDADTAAKVKNVMKMVMCED